MPELEELISKFTPRQLDIYKEQLARLPERKRQLAYKRLSSVRGFESSGRTMTREEETPFWQQALSKATTPFRWIEENVTQPFGAIVTSPWTPEIEGTEGMSWLERERAEYQEWDDPNWGFLGVKGIVETLPWLAIPSAGGLIGKAGMMGAKGAGLLGVAARGGALARPAGIVAKALKPAAMAERAIVYPITKPLEMAAKKILPKAQEVAARLVPDLQPFDEALSIATQPSRLRSLANISIAGKQPVRSLAKMIAGQAAAARNPAEFGLLGRNILRFEGGQKASVALASLNRLGTSKKIFNLTDDGLMNIGGKQVHLNEVRTYPQKYTSHLNPQQKQWIEQAVILEREKKALLDRYGIEIPGLTFEEGGVYAGRRVLGKFDAEGNLIDTAFIGVGQPARPGAKVAFEKARVYENIDDAIKEGFRYLPEEDALYYNMVGAYNRVADRQFTDYFLANATYRTMAGPEDLKAQVNLMRAGITSARNSLKNSQRQLRQSAREVERQHPIVFRASEEVGDLATDITNRKAIGEEVAFLMGKLQAEKKMANRLANAYSKSSTRNEKAYQKVLDVEQRLTQRIDELAEIEPIWADALAKARRPEFGQATLPDIPAFAKKVFTDPEAQEWINIIRKELNPNFSSALHAINQVNAVGRYFALAGDASPFAIQLIFLAGYNPKAFGSTMKGFVKAMFDKTYHDNLLAKNAPLLNRHPGLVTAKGGATELTEAMARGGLLRKGPLKIAGKALEPFQRGFETALDTAGIELAKSLQHLGTTPARMAQVDAFINEFRGLMNTQRIGISSTQRQLERAVVLAPQYNRAIGALMFDISQGNLRGQLARRAVGQGTAAIMAMSVAVSYALGESTEEMVDHLNPLSTNFMTWDIAGQRVGPGSKVRSVLYTFGKMTKDPENSAHYAGQFMRGNFSPVLGTSMDLITGKNYIGDPTRDGLMSFTQTTLGENMMPIWLQSVAFEGGDFAQRVTRGMAEFGGMRAYPASGWTLVKDMQDKLAMEKHGVPWDELGQRPEGYTAQLQLSKTPELAKLMEESKEQSERWARGDQLVWNDYTRATNRIQGVVKTELDQASRQFMATRDGFTLRQRVNQAYFLKGQMMRDLLQDPQFTIVKDTFEGELTPEQIEKMQPQKLLYREYNNMMYSADMFDEYGEYKFDEAKLRREQFVKKHGLEALNSVEEVIGEKRIDEPEAVKMLRQAREILRPYWQIADSIWAMHPPQLKQLADRIAIMGRTNPQMERQALKRYPVILRVRELIARYRKQMRDRSPAINWAVKTFY